MAFIPNNSPIVKRLIETGILPKLCTKFSLTINVNEPLRMTSECFVTEEQFREIADALIENPEEAKRIAHTHCVESAIDRRDAEYRPAERHGHLRTHASQTRLLLLNMLYAQVGDLT
jgi:hypothetical protein